MRRDDDVGGPGLGKSHVEERLRGLDSARGNDGGIGREAVSPVHGNVAQLTSSLEEHQRRRRCSKNRISGHLIQNIHPEASLARARSPGDASRVGFVQEVKHDPVFEDGVGGDVSGEGAPGLGPGGGVVEDEGVFEERRSFF